MNAPFFKFGVFGDEASLVVAFVIGIGFGFFLERAGFGSARKLTDQFYFKDMAVFRVMFTAIVTAMLGLFYLARRRLGRPLAGLSSSRPTSGRRSSAGCCSASASSSAATAPARRSWRLATGKLDALVFVAGVFAGVFVDRRGLAGDHRLRRVVGARPPDAARGASACRRAWWSSWSC